MAIDDSTNYTLTGAQVKDLAARIKAGGGGGMTVYVDAPFDDVSSITNVFSDSGLTTVADWSDMADAILAGITVTAVYDNGSNKHQYVELTSVNVNDNVAVGKRFGGVLTENSGVSLPIIIFLYYDDGSLTPRWYAESVPVPTKTSDLTNDGSDGTSTYVEADDLATVATTGDYNDLSNLPSDRLYRMLVPTGTEITSNKNLNTTEFLSVGRYYCSANATVATLTNCPTSSAFMMEVFSPLSTTIDNETTSPWVYRLRLLTTYNGETWVQQVDSGSTAGSFTYRTWKRYSIPDIKSAAAVSDCGWEADKNKIPDCSMLAFWNGAYSGTASNLKYFANSSVTTANLQNDCVTASKLYDRNTANTTDTWMLVLNGDKIQHRVVKTFNSDGSIPKSAMHGIPAPDPSSVITNWGSISASGNNEKTISADGFVVGKGCTFGGDQSAIVKLNGQDVGGVSYTTFTGYMQVAYCIPVRSGDKVQFYLNKSGPQHQGCKLIGWKM